MKKRAIIIGAGPAGLTAAYELLNNTENIDVIVLEETSQLGGISRTICHNGNRMDIGGHRFFSKEDRIMQFWKDILPLQGYDSFDDKVLNRNKPLAQSGPDPEADDKVMLVRNRVSRIYYLKKFFDYPISMKLQTIKNLGFWRTSKAGFSYIKSVVLKRKENSLEDFYINRFGKTLYKMFFEDYTEKVWGRHPAKISADWGAQRVKGLSIRTLLKDMLLKAVGKKQNGIEQKNTETSLIEQFLYPKYGPGQLWETLGEMVVNMGGNIVTNAKVTDIELCADTVKSVIYQQNGTVKNIEADYVISSMPIKDLVAGIKGNIPEKVKKAAAGLPYRDFVTVGLLLKKLNLKNETNIKTLGNIVPDCWIYVQEPAVKLGRIQIFNNWSPYMVKNVAENVWIGLEYFCSEGDDFWNMSGEESAEFAINELVSMGLIDKNDVLDWHRERVKKAYPAYFDTYSEIDCIIEYLNGIKNLYCVGRNGQHRYNNMDHSMLTSIYAVDSIIKGTDKTRIWKVNTEQEYHEEK